MPTLGPSSADADRVVVRTNSTSVATWSMNALFERLVSASETGGQLGASVVTQPSGAASPLHVHTREAEAWYLLEGAMTYRAGTELVRLGVGDFIYLPRNVPHGFRVTSPSPARFLALTVPGQLMELYDEVGRPAPERRLPDGGLQAEEIARWNEVSARYGIQIVGPPIEQDHPTTPTSRA